MNFFNNQGELNASSVRDALMTLSKFASVMQDNVPSNLNLISGPTLSEREEDDLIMKAILSQEGKIALAQAMANPIRTNLDFQGMARRFLVPDPLINGANASYERDINVAATVISANGAPPESRVFGDRFTVPTWIIAANPTVRIQEARRRRFNIIDRTVQKGRQEIMAQEDANVFGAIDSASTVENVEQDLTDTGLTKRDLAQLKIEIDQWDLLTTKFAMNIREFNDILLWGSGGGQGANGGEFDPVTMREVLQTGLYARLWGADILVSKIVPRGTVYAAADPEFVGVMPIAQDIEVLPADEPKQMKLGWVISEEIGIAIANPRGVAKGRKDYAIG